MARKLNYTEKLFSYGTLQNTSVQLVTFNRRLEGTPDTLQGYSLSELAIQDADVINTSGIATHPIVRYTGNHQNTVQGHVFLISVEELAHADRYEVDDYK